MTKKTIIRDIDFIEFLLSSKEFKDEIFYPARVIYENCLRIKYIENKSEKEKQEIAVLEVLRLCWRYYKISNKTKGRVFQKQFDEVGGGKYGSIENFNKKISNKNDAFPCIYNMLEEISLKRDIKSEYYLYQGLCESSHGKILGRDKDSNFYAYLGVVSEKLDMIDK